MPGHLSGTLCVWSSATVGMAEDRPRARKGRKTAVSVTWTPGDRTAAWDALWARILAATTKELPTDEVTLMIEACPTDE